MNEVCEAYYKTFLCTIDDFIPTHDRSLEDVITMADEDRVRIMV